jgi:hypothetical protein
VQFNDVQNQANTFPVGFYKTHNLADTIMFKSGGIWYLFINKTQGTNYSFFKIKTSDYMKNRINIEFRNEIMDISLIPEGSRYHATVNYVCGVKGNAESAYRTGNVNLTADNIGALPITGNDYDGPTSMTGNINLGKSSMNNSPKIQWRDKNRYVWAGTANSSGSWYLWDSTNSMTIIRSDLNGYGYAYGGTKAYIYTNQEGGNLRLTSPNGTVRSEIDLHDNASCRWYVQNAKDGSILSDIYMSADGSINVHGEDNVFLRANRNLGGVVVMDVDGSWGLIQASNFSVQSSRRYKENIQPMTEKRAKTVLDVEIVTFDYKYGISSNPLDRTGVIAEDVIRIIPEVVNYTIIDNDKAPDSVDYSMFVPYLIKMVQIQQEEIDQLKAQNAVLSDRLEAIEKLGVV